MVVTTVVTTGFYGIWREGEPVYGHEEPPEGLQDSLELILLLESLFNMEMISWLSLQVCPPRE